MPNIPNTFQGKFQMPPFRPKGIDEGMALLANMLYGQFTGGRCVGGDVIDISDAEIHELIVPAGSISALIVLTCDDASIATLTPEQSANMAMFSQTDTRVNEVLIVPMLHMPMGHMGVVEIKGTDNMKNFRIKLSPNQTGVTGQKVRVEFFA